VTVFVTFVNSESTAEGRRITRLDRILLNGNNITMVRLLTSVVSLVAVFTVHGCQGGATVRTSRQFVNLYMTVMASSLCQCIHHLVVRIIGFTSKISGAGKVSCLVYQTQIVCTYL